ncbi:Hypothetical protein FKW44_006200, partial [Caligus rogercresseyi]
MIGGNAKKKDVAVFTINVGGVEVHPSDEIEFLGVQIDTDSREYLTTSTSLRQQQSGLHSSLGLLCTYQEENTTAAGQGLMIGKISYAAAAVTIPRHGNECKGPNAVHTAIQVAINDATRSIVG